MDRFRLFRFLYTVVEAFIFLVVAYVLGFWSCCDKYILVRVFTKSSLQLIQLTR